MNILKFFKENSARIHKPLSYIIKLALILAIAYSIYFHLWRILFINLMLLILIFIPILSKKIDVEIPKEFDFIILIFIAISFFLGDLRGLIIQMFFGITIGFVGFALIMILYKNSGLKPNYPLIILFSLSISLALGTLSELSKFFLKSFLGSNLVVEDYIFSMVKKIVGEII